MQDEVWRPVVGYEDYYEVSNLGRLRTVGHIIEYSDGRRRHVRGGRMISYGKPRPNGYYIKCLQRGNTKKYVTIHRLVATAFIPNPMGLEQINHINGNKIDNRVENLEWITREDNMLHAVYTLGKVTGVPAKKIICVETGEIFDSRNSAMKAKGCDVRNLSKVIDKNDRTLGGYHWRNI